MTAKRILLLDTGREWGGGTNSMIELLKRLDRRRFAVTALFYRDYRKGTGSTLSAELAAIGIPFRLLPPTAPLWWEKPAKELARGLGLGNHERARRWVFAVERCSRIAPMAKRIAEEIHGDGSDLLYMNNQPASNVEGFLAGAAAGIPVVQHCRGEPVMTPAVVALTNRHAASVICVSEGVRETLVGHGVVAERCVTVHNGIDIHQPTPIRRTTTPWQVGAVNVAIVGRLVPLKRVDDLLFAIARLRRQEPTLDIRLAIFGEGGEATALAARIERLNLGDRACLAGFEQLPMELVATADILVQCSEREGLPRVALEAMLLGKPVIASAVTGSREVVVHGETGLLYPCGDVAALADALARLAADADLRQRLGEAGARRVREHFSIERYVAGVERVLADVLEVR
jgi:L-malate glycosyltransferase